jgi:hypothetical protein
MKMASTRNENTISLLFLLAYSYILISPIWSFMRIYDIVPFYNYNIILLPLLFLLVLTVMKKSMGNIVFNKYSLIGTVLICFIIIIQFVSLPFVLSYSPNSIQYYTSTIFSTILLTVIMWLVGINFIGILKFILKNHRIKLLIKVTYAIYVFFILYGLYLNGINTTNILSLQVTDLDGQYLSLAGSFAVLSLIISGFIKKLPYSILFHFVTMIMLLVLISRSSFVFYAITAFLILFIKLIKEHKKSSVFIFSLIIIIILLNINNLNEIKNTLETSNNRILFTIFNQDVSEDTSLNARQLYLEKGLKNIQENWLLGKFMWYIESNEEEGTYIHNWLSFYSNYGLIPFILFVLLAISLLIKVIRNVYSNYNNLHLMVFGILFFNLLSIVFTKSFHYVYIWLALGMASNQFQSMEEK